MSDRASPSKKRQRQFRRAVLRGLGVVLPPVLTIVIFLWVGNTVRRYILEPLNVGAQQVLAGALADVHESLPGAEPVPEQPNVYQYDGKMYRKLTNDQFVPEYVYDTVRRYDGASRVPDTAQRLYARYVELQYLQPYVTIPVTALAFIVVMYLLGRFIAAGIGRVFWAAIERGIDRLPLVRNVYSSVKQVTDFMFSEGEIEYTRVVAVEYPRRGIWSIGLVTSESLLDIRAAANETVLSVLIPSSPMPVTGYTINVPKSDTIDLNITIDQAFQFCVSCGVVVPPHQVPGLLDAAAASSATGSNAEEGTTQNVQPATTSLAGPTHSPRVGSAADT